MPWQALKDRHVGQQPVEKVFVEVFSRVSAFLGGERLVFEGFQLGVM